MKPVVTTFRLTTTGAAAGTFADLALTSASGGSVWQTLSGVIETDATPTNIVVTLAATAANAQCHVKYIDAFPLGDDPIERSARNWGRSRTVSTNNIATLRSSTEIRVVCPGPGYRISMQGYANVNLLSTIGNDSNRMDVIIQRSTDGGATFPTDVATVMAVMNTTGFGGDTLSTVAPIPVAWAEESPTPGTVYGFRLSATIAVGDAALDATFPAFFEVKLERN